MERVVSVIVPAYNAGRYIEQCIASLLAQTVPLEIIVVNDGSTDDSSEKVSAIKSTGLHRLVLVEQDNQGLSMARNTGLCKAQGEFVGFVDADDWVEPDMYANMTSAARQSGAELVICNGALVDHYTLRRTPFQDQERFAALANAYGIAVDARTVPELFRLDTSACKRLYHRSLLQRIHFRFVHGVLFEDIVAHYELLLAARSVLLIDREFYNYRINHPGRITDRADAEVLTVFDMIGLSADILRSNRASDDVWANFIWFQNWVLRWLASQIALPHRHAFAERAVTVGRQFSRSGIQQFQRRFHDDEIAQCFVALQLFGWSRTFMSLAANELGERDRRALARVARMRKLAPFFGRG